jgi:hypothetical protein
MLQGFIDGFGLKSGFFPNKTVLGDAAGIAAGRSILKKKNPLDFSGEDNCWIQTKLIHGRGPAG